MSNFASNRSVYLRTNWSAWRLLGAVELNTPHLGSINFWAAATLNMVATGIFPGMLIMVMFTFDEPLDNLMNFNLSLTSVATSAKFLIYVKQLRKVLEIEQLLSELDARMSTDEQRKCHATMSRIMRITSTLYKWTYSLIGVNANMSFLFRDQRSLPFPAWFPLDYCDSMPNYCLAVMHQILCISMQIMQNFVSDLFPPLALLLIAGQCELLILRISQIGYDHRDQRANEQELIRCIQDQKKIYRMHELTMDIMSYALLVQFIVIAIDVGAALCALFFYVQTMQDRIYYTSFLFALALQTLPVCYLGTLVEENFKRLPNAVYSSNWMDQSIAYRQNAIIFAERTQRIPKQVAGNFIPIALTTFLANCETFSGNTSKFLVTMAMETILGIRGTNFAMLACDTMQAKSVIFMKDDQSKIHRLSEFSMLAAVGDGGDTLQFTDYIARHLQLYKVSNGYHLSPRGAAHFTRKNLADYIRTNTRYQVSMLMAGYDATEGAALHYIDSYGASMSINHAGHGLGSLFCGSIFQRYWKEDLKPDQAYDILKMCVLEIQKRLVINLRNFDVFVVDQNGTRKLDSINPSSLDADMCCLSLPASVHNLGKGNEMKKKWLRKS